MEDCKGIVHGKHDLIIKINVSLTVLYSLILFSVFNSDSEMRGVYLKSVRSPALGNRFKMVHRAFNNTAIFSQV